MITIRDHRLIDDEFPVDQHSTNNTTGHIITPKFLVMHHTAWLDYDAVVNWFKNPVSKVSAHLVIDTDGKVAQVLPFNVKGWHCGPSYWRGMTDINSHSIGIELVNYGWTPHKNAAGFIEPRRPGEFDPQEVGKPDSWLHAAHKLEPNEPKFWQKFTAKQFEVLDEIVPLIVDEYKIREIVGHEEIAVPAGRKVDPGPAFPLAHYKEYTEHGNGTGAGQYIVVAEDGLNLRGGPGTNYNVIAKLKRGDSVKVLKFDGDWALVQVDKQRGHVHSAYIMKA